MGRGAEVGPGGTRRAIVGLPSGGPVLASTGRRVENEADTDRGSRRGRGERFSR